MTRKRLAFIALALFFGVGVLGAAACTSADSCSSCEDVVSTIPWSAPDTQTYRLEENGSKIGTTTLTIERQGDSFALTQATKDDKGNSDTSVVNADAKTLKPTTTTRTIIDSKQRSLFETTYESIGTDKCSAGQQETIKRSVFSPPDSTKPDSTRVIAKCVPEHAYDTDESLFLWRTIEFADGKSVTYETMAQGDKHLVTLTVQDKEQVTVPAGTFDTWKVEIASERSRQYAWFTTTSEHRLVQYANNQGQTFLLQ
jgi:hypothetical protein